MARRITDTEVKKKEENKNLRPRGKDARPEELFERGVSFWDSAEKKISEAGKKRDSVSETNTKPAHAATQRKQSNLRVNPARG